MPIKVKPPIEPDEIIAAHYRKIGKKRWKNMNATERSEYASKIAKKRWSKMNKKTRSEYMKKIGFGGNTKKV